MKISCGDHVSHDVKLRNRFNSTNDSVLTQYGEYDKWEATISEFFFQESYSFGYGNSMCCQIGLKALKNLFGVDPGS